MHRTQVMLTDEQYLTLKREAQRSGQSIGELVRSAVAEVYDLSQHRIRNALKVSRGAWADRDDITDGAEYVDQIRTSGARRLQDLDKE